ncbi:Acetyltransferase (GNAT) domain-containing protein [Arenibacter palladensis]|uniref:Acetyltransferase (GNAT) domain-containing protein n=1 Tax=Arenibacter palladensis TaxID=237373 RepID=A0A1M5EJI6_9FLAO|nr:GNAT family N-acetyltransferase [Arenibacter palladensis]SHF79367.1 Acetyltransferase (GNAT) domain-containing protein [Arenibacter palladensis]
MSNNIIFDAVFYERKTECSLVNNVYLKNSPEKSIYAQGSTENNFKSGIRIVDDVPPYVNIEFQEKYDSYQILNSSVLDFYVNLEGYSDVQEYLKSQMGAKSRSRLRGLVNRLEKCFDITYKIYFGEITKEEYELLFEYLKKFIEERFSQRGDKHQAMEEWNLYKERTFEMILKKEASLYVIYNENRPIDICLNYHIASVYVNKIRSYDIDYSKFRLGYIDIIKQLEWCLENNYAIFDLMRGDLRYKREFCNNIINFDRYILYKRNSLSGKLMAYLKTKELVLRPKLKFVKTAFRKVLKKKESDVNSEPNEPTETIIINLSEFPKDIEVELIDINQKEYALLRKGVYDYQYSTSEHSKGIQIFKIKDVPNSYIIKGQSNMVQMEI